MRGDLSQSEHSKELDVGLKEIAKSLDIPDFIYYPKLKHTALKKVGCAPDGGVWFKNGYLEVAFEAKHQGFQGNAIERWFKNYWLVSQIWPQAKFITFCTGEGVKENGPIWANFNMVLNLEGKADNSFNMIHKTGASFFLQEYGFSKSATKSIMETALLEDEPSGILLC